MVLRMKAMNRRSLCCAFGMTILFGVLGGCAGGAGSTSSQGNPNVFAGLYSGSLRDLDGNDIAHAVVSVDRFGAATVKESDGRTGTWSGLVGNSGSFTGTYTSGPASAPADGWFNFENPSTLKGTLHDSQGPDIGFVVTTPDP